MSKEKKKKKKKKKNRKKKPILCELGLKKMSKTFLHQSF